MLLPAATRVGLWPAMVAVQGPGTRTENHRHHSLHLVLARTGRLSATVGKIARRATGVWTPPDADHSIDATGAPAIIFFVDPECASGAALKQSLAGQSRWLDEGERDVLLNDLSTEPNPQELTDWMGRALSAIGVARGATPAVHPKVRQVLRLLAEAPLDPAPSLEAWAARVGLSASRLMHIFTESTGAPWRTYLRWLRFQRAAGAIVSGVSLTEAAVRAGFHDSAHMARTFREVYGLSPSQLQRRRPSA